MAARKKNTRARQKGKRKKTTKASKVSKATNIAKKRVKELQIKLQAALAKKVPKPKQEACTSTEDFHPEKPVPKELTVSPSEYDCIVKGLKNPKINNRHKILSLIHNHMVGLEVRFQKEIFDLEDRYFKEYYAPLQALRKALVEAEANGKQSFPNEKALVQNCKSSFGNDLQKFKEFQLRTERLLSSGYGEVSKKCQDFWLVVLLHSDTILRNLIQPEDIDILRYLADVRTEPVRLKAARQFPPNAFPDDGDRTFRSVIISDVAVGYDIIFNFRSNPYFSNHTLTKRYLIDILPDQCDYVTAPHSDVISSNCSLSWNDNGGCDKPSFLCDAILNQDHSIDKLLDYNGPQVIAIQGCQIRWTTPCGAGQGVQDDCPNEPTEARDMPYSRRSPNFSRKDGNRSKSFEPSGFPVKSAQTSTQVLRKEACAEYPRNLSPHPSRTNSTKTVISPSEEELLANSSFGNKSEMHSAAFSLNRPNSTYAKSPEMFQGGPPTQQSASFSTKGSSAPSVSSKSSNNNSFPCYNLNMASNKEACSSHSPLKACLPVCAAVAGLKKLNPQHSPTSQASFERNNQSSNNASGSKPDKKFVLARQFPFPRANTSSSDSPNSISQTNLERYVQAPTSPPQSSTNHSSKAATSSSEAAGSERHAKKSFFNFFEVSWNEKAPDHCREVARDYQVGSYIRDVLIPRAYMFYRQKDLADHNRETREHQVVTSIGNRYEKEFRMGASVPSNYDEIDEDIPVAISNQALKTIESCASFKKEIIDNNKETVARIANSFIGKMVRRHDDIDDEITVKTKKCRSSTFEEKIDVDDAVVTSSSVHNVTAANTMYDQKSSESSTFSGSGSQRSVSSLPEVFEQETEENYMNSGISLFQPDYKEDSLTTNSSTELRNDILSNDLAWNAASNKTNDKDRTVAMKAEEHHEESAMNLDYQDSENPPAPQSNNQITIFSGYNLKKTDAVAVAPEVGDTEVNEKPTTVENESGFEMNYTPPDVNVSLFSPILHSYKNIEPTAQNEANRQTEPPGAEPYDVTMKPSDEGLLNDNKPPVVTPSSNQQMNNDTETESSTDNEGNFA